MTCPHGYPNPASCLDYMDDEGLGAAPVRPVVAEYTFHAVFDGQCPACDLPIREDQFIARMSDETYRHEACLQ